MRDIIESIKVWFAALLSRLPVCHRHPDICGFVTAFGLLAVTATLLWGAWVFLAGSDADAAEADLLDYGHPAPFLIFGTGLELGEKFTKPSGEEGNPVGMADVSWCPARKNIVLLCGGYRHHSSAPQENDFLTIDELYGEVQTFLTRWAALQARYGWENGQSLGSRWQWSVGTRLCGGSKQHWWEPCTGLMHTRGETNDITVWWFGVGFNPQPIEEVIGR